MSGHFPPYRPVAFDGSVDKTPTPPDSPAPQAKPGKLEPETLRHHSHSAVSSLGSGPAILGHPHAIRPYLPESRSTALRLDHHTAEFATTTLLQW